MRLNLPNLCRSRSQWWGFCSIRSWLSACRRRVMVLMTPFSPFGGSPSVALVGVVPKVQTASAKTDENGLLWARWSAFWAQRCLSWSAACTRTPLYARKPVDMRLGGAAHARRTERASTYSKGPAIRPTPSSIPSTQCKSSDALPFLAHPLWVSPLA